MAGSAAGSPATAPGTAPGSTYETALLLLGDLVVLHLATLTNQDEPALALPPHQPQ